MEKPAVGERIFGIESKTVSRVVTNSVGVSMDSSLDKRSGARVWLEMSVGWDLILEKTGVILFDYDVKGDVLYYRQISGAGVDCVRKVRDFRSVLEDAARCEDSGRSDPAKALLAAAVEKASEELKGYFSMFSRSPELCRIAYRSLVDPSGGIYAVVGFYQQAENDISADPVTQGNSFSIAEASELEQSVNRALGNIKPGHKGSLFLFTVCYPKMSNSYNHVIARYIQAAADAVRSDFRESDILGQAAERIYAVFICGNISIDIVERRAQRILDLCQRTPLLQMPGISCYVGAATTSSPKQTYQVLFRQAEQALQEAQRHGSTQYRLYEDEKIGNP